MPELPEVESIRLQLTKYVVGHKIEKTEINYKKCFQGDPNKLKQAKIGEIRRFGKAIVIDLNNKLSILIHVKMTGQLIYRGPNLSPAPAISDKVKGGLGGKHTHVVFHLNKDAKLFFNDYRKFGWIKVVKTDEVEEDKFIKNIGPEPFKDLTIEYFTKTLSKTKRNIKSVLMDQKVVAGVGNIYANDALWLSGIHPTTPAHKLPPEKVKELYHAIEQVLQRGLADGGASENSFVTPDGADGNYQKHFLAYDKKGEKCVRCGGIFVKDKVGGRGSVYCPKCQKKY
ncbi:bifunctional DNA-formamidopyrimidine glycosylase/DNA-(apurinic or apyrimidinic site) lyase [Candidatus Woesebacteria bacterium]|nr:MAG: bifunctional DNA-formamidopyrimidine glycosylase/DNA-(apurinic or apyrimidinic site) lyase [Candidatus Woesebacteria bacterium]